MDLSQLNAEDKSSLIHNLQKEINKELYSFFEASKSKGREFLARALIEKIESIIDKLNRQGYNFGCIEYSGDINYENSEQWYSNGPAMGTGIVLHFQGFSVKASWENDQEAPAPGITASPASVKTGETGEEKGVSGSGRSLPLTWFMVIFVFSIFVGYSFGVWWFLVLFTVYLLTGVVSVIVRWRLDNREKSI